MIAGNTVLVPSIGQERNCDSPMHVAFVVYNPNDNGSVIDTTRRQVEWLVRNDIRVSIVANQRPQGWASSDVEVVSFGQTFVEGWVNYAVNGAARRFSRRFRRWDTSAYFAQRAFDAAASTRLREIAARQPIECTVCVQHFCAPGLHQLQQHLRIPFIVVAHGDIFSHPPDSFSIPLTRLYRSTANLAYRHANHVVTVGSELRRRAIECGAEPANVTVVPNGIEPSSLQGETHPAANRKCELELLYVGRLAPEKGVEVLLKSLADWTHASGRLRIVGDGPSADSLKRLATSIATQIQIEFIGAVTRSALGNFYNSSDIAVIPSLAEAQGIVALEAMACGIPVVASHVGGIPEMVSHEVSGLLVEPGNPAELGAALRSLAAAHEKRQAMSIQAVATAEHFHWSSMLPKFLAVLTNTVHMQRNASHA